MSEYENMRTAISTIIKKNDKTCYEVKIEDEIAPKIKLGKSSMTGI
jgi:hypothetical protein